MKKIGALGIIVGIILILLSMVGFYGASGTSSEDLEMALEIAEYMDYGSSLSGEEQFSYWLIKNRTGLLIVGLIAIAGGAILRKGKINTTAIPETVGDGRSDSSAEYAEKSRPSNGKEQRDRPKSVSARMDETERLLPYSEDRCCICNEPLEDGYAVLYKNKYGAESRIDSHCFDLISTLSKSENKREVRQALVYIRSRTKYVDPIVFQHLQPYIQAGEEFINQ